MSAPIVVFDLDGTLVDTAPDLVDTLNAILAREGVPPVPFAEARTMIGGGARRMLERGLAAGGWTGHAADIERLFLAFIANYEAHIADRSRPFAHAEAALDRLAANGYRFAICTNKLERLSIRLLEALALSHRFAAICGQDTFGVQKPNPEILRQTILRAAGVPQRALLVGDSATDIRTARAAGVPVIAVDFGYTDTPVAEFTPDRIVSSFDALPPAVGELLPLGRSAAVADVAVAPVGQGSYGPRRGTAAKQPRGVE
jgi:phosphoglycolate phosphatase